MTVVPSTSHGDSRVPWTGPFELPTTERLRSHVPASVSPLEVARSWFQAFKTVIQSPSPDISRLFLADGFWRDLLALSWDFRSIQGSHNINGYLQSTINLSGFRPLKLIEEPLRAPALLRPFPDILFLVFSFNFETSVGKGIGTCRLVNSHGEWKAYTMFTTLDTLSGFTEKAGALRDSSMSHGDWVERRHAETEFTDSDPTVIVIGSGHVGLGIAARLQAFGVRTLVVEQNSRIGDNWRNRYKTLSLQNSVWFDHLPYMPYPTTWPVYAPACKLGDWLEGYSRALDLNVWTSSTVRSARWSPASKKWSVNVQRDGSTRDMQVKHLVFATGWGGNLPNIPSIADQDKYVGQVLHSSKYTTPEEFSGKKIIVVGACTSGHDIAHDFSNYGADVTMFQRSPTFVVSTKICDSILSGLYFEGNPTELADHMSASLPLAVTRQFHQRSFPAAAATVDRPILEGLAKVGFMTNLGPGNAGVLPLVYERAGGYYLDAGASQQIIDGKIKLKSGGSIEKFTPNGLRFSDGSELTADVIIFATGYGNPRDVVKDICGPEVYVKLKPVWGLNEEGELRSVWRESGHEGLWFAMGNLSMSRYFSKLLALRIKAEEEGLVSA